MKRSWKSVLHEYVQAYNRLEADYSLDALNPLVSDEQYKQMQQTRLHRMSFWHKERNVRPIRCEMRLNIADVTLLNNEVEADIHLHKQQHIETGQSSYTEERIERQRVILTREGDDWLISAVRIACPEKYAAPSNIQTNPAQQTAIPSAASTQPEPNVNSVPFISETVFSHWPKTVRHVRYDRLKAKQYADEWWNRPNPAYAYLDVDCTNFVSQCLYAGNAPMNYTGKREKGWWYKGRIHNREMWSYSWAVSDSLRRFLGSSTSGLRAERVESPAQLTIGDVIIYDFDGDGKFQHSTIVTALDANGMPLVNAHTTNSRNRYWDYRDSYAWSENTTYRFFHIGDWF